MGERSCSFNTGILADEGVFTPHHHIQAVSLGFLLMFLAYCFHVSLVVLSASLVKGVRTFADNRVYLVLPP